MEPVSTAAAAIASFKAAFDIIKSIRGKPIKKAELEEKLSDIIKALNDAQIQLAEMQNAIIEKDNKIRELQDKLTIKENIVFEDPFYWIDKDGVRDGPYCPRCYDSDGKLVRPRDNYNGIWSCMNCKTAYGKRREQRRPHKII